ncbi:efflux RND transporter periplasmic adaptor subunit [Aquirhabdus parva]|uniref:HlyD family efflux transporter periplasmic adaptor subunit n=1 Tax=Aquirhabdus parva TaxID=2283318 RepID=A0A345P9U2_9GAMM|nr:efflux RND transporter periplasmic adaptor subunit [Aquirhabdus parva]AXI04051.1 HlyD family efflux transporter periplasmic adaptor subunit [Aquirhabdus parva]
MTEQNTTPEAAATPAAPETAPANGKRKPVLLIIAAVFITIAVLYALYYFLIVQFREGTDDAYVNGNLVYVNTQVSGTVVSLGADDTQSVKAGQMLVTLEGADSSVGLANAQASLAQTVRQTRQQYRSSDEASAVVAQRQTDLTKVTDDLNRRTQLAGTDALTGEDLAHARAAVATAKDALIVAQKQLESSQASVEGTTLRQHPAVLQARAQFVQAYLASQRNVIPSPIEGYVARRAVQIGQRVTSGTNLMAIVPLNGLWIDANLKETQLRNVRIGQPVKVTTDVYGGHVEYHGKVAGIAAGTGGAFSLLPPQNAAGNWIKVVQRVPVRIALDPNDLVKHPLRIGMSTIVDIDTHNRDGSVLTSLPIANVPMTTPVFDQQLKDANAKADEIIAHEAGSNS